MNFLGLQAFLSVAERGSFQQASAHLNLSPTALSHRMKKFEDELGVKLFSRTTRQVTLTQAGLDLLPKARRIVQDMDAVYEELVQHGRARERQLNIGCLPTLALNYLPTVLAQFHRRYPAMAIRVFDNAATELHDLLQAGTIEFAVTIVAAQSWDLDIQVLAKEPFVLVCHHQHKFARRDAVTWSDIEKEPLIRLAPEAGNRMILDDALGARKDSLNWRFEVQHIATAVHLAAASIGLAVLPRTAISSDVIPQIRLIPLRNPVVSRSLGIVTRRGSPLSAAAAQLSEMISSSLQTA